MAHALAGKPVQEQDIIDVQTIVDAYFDNVPDMTNPTQLVSFGTSGHRGTSVDGTFTDLHVAAITQAICDGRKQFGGGVMDYIIDSGDLTELFGKANQR